MIKTIFTDIGGVLLTNGWDRKALANACEKFHLDKNDFEERHHLTFDTYEEGKISLDEYLMRTVFFEKRSFSKEDFKEFMYSQSQPLQEMMDLMKSVKQKNQIKIVAVSNEGKELTKYRIHEFKLNSFIDFFVSSSFVHLRKPDEDIFQMALSFASCNVEEGIYIDDRELFVEVASRLGLKGIHHTTAKETSAEFQQYGIIV
jgi:putative hydrolase of the HAD superfamily